MCLVYFANSLPACLQFKQLPNAHKKSLLYLLTYVKTQIKADKMHKKKLPANLERSLLEEKICFAR